MTSRTEKYETNRLFLQVVQGTLRQSVPEGTHDAIKRDWEAGGEKGTKYELVSNIIYGHITDISFYDGESSGRKFQNLQIVFEEDENGKVPVVSTGVGTRYASDLMKKLPNVDLTEEVRLRPFAFTPDGEEKVVTGVEITQRDGTGQFNKKIVSFFHRKNEKGKWESVNGFPLPEGDTANYTSDDWDIFYKTCRRFLVQYMRENILPKFFERQIDVRVQKTAMEYPEESINPEDIPF